MSADSHWKAIEMGKEVWKMVSDSSLLFYSLTTVLRRENS